jgi:hypothetical protein
VCSDEPETVQVRDILLATQKGVLPMADYQGSPSVPSSRPTHQTVDTVQALLEKLKSEARAAEQANDAFMLGVYKELIKVVSPIVTRAIARIDREEKAAINKAHKGLLKAEREARQAQPPSA